MKIIINKISRIKKIINFNKFKKNVKIMKKFKLS